MVSPIGTARQRPIEQDIYAALFEARDYAIKAIDWMDSGKDYRQDVQACAATALRALADAVADISAERDGHE